MEICLVGAEWLHAAGRTDGLMGMTKLIVAFRNFANEPKNLSLYFAKSLASGWPVVRKSCTPLAQIISEQA